MNEKYKKIADLPHHQSLNHPQMTLHDRAAQFAPFAALTGYGDAVDETARLVDFAPVLSEDENAVLDERIKKIRENIGSQPEITVMRFVPDERKSGGAFVPFKGKVKRLNEVGRKIVFADGTEIRYDEIFGIESEIFGGREV